MLWLSGVAAALLPLAVINGTLVTEDASGVYTPFQLRGVVGTSLSYQCLANSSIFDGPVNDSYIAAMLTWKINAVTVGLNENCLLGINVDPQYGGAAYVTALAAYVRRLLARGLYVILSLYAEERMPDFDHSPAFWAAVTREFGSTRQVVFGLYNTPSPVQNAPDVEKAWECWQQGLDACVAPDGGNAPLAVGMVDLAAVVRASNGTNVLLLTGIRSGNSLGNWSDYAPVHSRGPGLDAAASLGDIEGRVARFSACRRAGGSVGECAPLARRSAAAPAALARFDNVAAAWNAYGFDICNRADCWNATLGGGVLARGNALVATELGDIDCGDLFLSLVVPWLTGGNGYGRRVSFMGSAWFPGGCSSSSLIRSYDGECLPFIGCTFKELVMAISAGGA